MKRIKTLEKLTLAACLTLGSGNLFAQQVFHDWTGVTSGGGWTFTNTSIAGTITGTSTSFAPVQNSLTAPAITQTTFTTGFSVGYPGNSIDFSFSPGYGWGNGGQMIIGNIHNYFEYTLSAWDFNNNPIDVNQWTIVGDFPYGWTPASKTNRTPSGNASKLFVFDQAASPGSGQGGILWLAGVKNAGRIRLTLTNNNLAPNGQGSDYIVFNVATPAVRVYEHCTQPATGFDGKLLKATWDSVHCYIKPVVAGTTPFIWNNSYYVAADKSTQCVPGAGSWDTANCYFMPKPAGGFLVNDSFYVPPVSGTTCMVGTWDGTGCLIKTAPWGTHAFEWQNGWYFTTIFTCKDGGYDGANCYIMSPPSGTIAFIYANNFYYAE